MSRVLTPRICALVLLLHRALRKPLTVGPVEWLAESSVGDEVVALLPRGTEAAGGRSTDIAAKLCRPLWQ